MVIILDKQNPKGWQKIFEDNQAIFMHTKENFLPKLNNSSLDAIMFLSKSV